MSKNYKQVLDLVDGMTFAKGNFDSDMVVSIKNIEGKEIGRGITYYNSENIDISSGFVDPQNSCLLVDEWLSAKNMWDYYIPYEKTEVVRKYKIESILRPTSENKGIDRFDPWGKDLPFPAPGPNINITRKFGLVSDNISRAWHKPVAPAEKLIRSLCWRGIEPIYQREAVEYGAILAFKREFLFDMLEKLKKDLIVEVKIYRGDDSKRNENYNQYTHPSFRLFIFRADGTILTP